MIVLKRKKLDDEFFQDHSKKFNKEFIQMEDLGNKSKSDAAMHSLKWISFEEIVIDHKVLGNGVFGFNRVGTLKKGDGTEVQVAVKVK